MHVFLLYKPEFLQCWQNYMAENSALAERMAEILVAPDREGGTEKSGIFRQGGGQVKMGGGHITNPLNLTFLLN